MLKNFFKIALRNISRNKGFSILNIGGLAIGMASALLVLLWVQNELSFWIFLTAGGAALAIAVLTVSFQSVKAANANPVTSLRSD